MRVTRPHRVYGSNDSAVLDGVLEVDAEQPVHCYTTGGRHNDVESYVVHGLHICVVIRPYTVQDFWLFWFDLTRW